jgi:hypothetical protein
MHANWKEGKKKVKMCICCFNIAAMYNEACLHPTSAMYNEACLHPTSLEPTFLFILRHVYDVFGLYRIPVYSGFGLW